MSIYKKSRIVKQSGLERSPFYLITETNPGSCYGHAVADYEVVAGAGAGFAVDGERNKAQIRRHHIGICIVVIVVAANVPEVAVSAAAATSRKADDHGYGQQSPLGAPTQATDTEQAEQAKQSKPPAKTGMAIDAVVVASGLKSAVTM